MGVIDKYYPPAADTIYLLSDGAPTNQDLSDDDPDRILRAVREWNRLGRMKIHTIGLKGHSVEFMSRLAREANPLHLVYDVVDALRIGADAVGMSTVPEVTIARHGGTRVLGLSGIGNVAPLEGAPPAEVTHEEVLETGQVLVPRLEAIIRGVLRSL